MAMGVITAVGAEIPWQSLTNLDPVAEEVSPAMMVYPAAESGAAKPCVLVIPGGGYAKLALDHEGHQVAKWLNELGLAAAVLKYRVGGGENRYPAPQNDAYRAMRCLRARAERFEIDPNRLGVLGFSAGGHLTSCVATLAPGPNPDAEDPIDRESSRPNFAVLVYPVISMQASATHPGSRNNLIGADASEELSNQLSTHLQVTEQTPPTLLIHAGDDTGVPVANSILFYQALVAHAVPAELHTFDAGGHGFGMRKLGKSCDRWTDLAADWLQRQTSAK